MEEGKKSGSSFASDLFGEKDSSSAVSSSGVFGSIFAPPPKGLGWELLHSSETEKKNSHGNPAWSPKNGVSDGNTVGGEGAKNTTSKDSSSYYLEEKAQPFNYNSSIYYGGQDFYSRPHNPESTTFNKDAVEDDSGSASRGNWWQGSLYY
ncbi:hypothetical protein ACP275_10G028800 [Erythranthe tilingii]